MWKRVILITFPFSFVDNPKESYEREKNPYLIQELQTESSGILAWLVRGSIEWHKHGLMIPNKIRLATKEYQDDEDFIGLFIKERCIFEENAEVQFTHRYGQYKKWCDEMGHKVLNSTRFGTELKTRFRHNRKEKGIFYQGLKLK